MAWCSGGSCCCTVDCYGTTHSVWRSPSTRRRGRRGMAWCSGGSCCCCTAPWPPMTAPSCACSVWRPSAYSANLSSASPTLWTPCLLLRMPAASGGRAHTQQTCRQPRRSYGHLACSDLCPHTAATCPNPPVDTDASRGGRRRAVAASGAHVLGRGGRFSLHACDDFSQEFAGGQDHQFGAGDHT